MLVFVDQEFNYFRLYRTVRVVIKLWNIQSFKAIELRDNSSKISREFICFRAFSLFSFFFVSTSHSQQLNITWAEYRSCLLFNK